MARPVVLVFLVDALGWEIVEQFGFGRDEFAVRSPLGTVLGYSAAAIPSLLSGATPAEHGSWAMFRRADTRGSFDFMRHVPRLPHPLEWRARRWVRRYSDARGDVRALRPVRHGRFGAADADRPGAVTGFPVSALLFAITAIFSAVTMLYIWS